MDVSLGAIVIDCGDPTRLMAFWQAVTGFEVEAENAGWGYLRDAAGRAPGLGFQKVPEGKVVKNRVHIDLYTPDHEAAAARIEGLGARRLWVSENPEDPFIVLADPEGNEFCVVHEAPAE